MNLKKVSFFVSAYNSFLWNIKASLVIKKIQEVKTVYLKMLGNCMYLLTICFSVHIFVKQEDMN